MENVLPKNRPSRCESVHVSRLQFDHIFTDAAAAKGEQIARELAALKDDIAPACDKTFVMMKNKKVWFDRRKFFFATIQLLRYLVCKLQCRL